ILGVIYFTLAARKDSVYLNEQRSFDTKKIVRFRILVWIVWVLFILGATLYTTAIRFGSNIWFGYRIRIDGPYRLAEILLDYILPFITLIIPLMFNRAKALIEKCGVKELP
ncbi:MAG: hypothetical protein Q8920_13240, partial [Bacillota bacterium]|nr:hypothetical protein [Bacillota bacterium]